MGYVRPRGFEHGRIFVWSDGVFEGLSERLGSVFDRLRKRGALGEADVGAAMREVRIALLEADVALPVVKQFVDRVRERAVGREVLRPVTPGDRKSVGWGKSGSTGVDLGGRGIINNKNTNQLT